MTATPTPTPEDLNRMYQLGYAHGANGLPPLTLKQIERAAELDEIESEEK